ncbi:MAG: ISAzo13 family transposase, partial [candidate division Zixibacteria bacterium]|nr:ISAzo13 family transposase [candidate division Zixibacteria bacterium]
MAAPWNEAARDAQVAGANWPKKKLEIIEVISSILEIDAAGDPMSKRRWTHQTAQKVADVLAERNIKVSATVVRRLLLQMNYSLKSNKKRLSSGNSPDRDPQFRMIMQLREEFSQTGDPIVSVDTKKKELIGLFKNSGKIWCQQAKKVKDHDFRSEADGTAVPYGIYD